MADTKPRHTNNINILPGENITFDQEDQNITINAVIPPTTPTNTCFPGGTFYLGSSILGPASDLNPGTDPAAPIATWARMRAIMGCLPITGPVIVKVRRGAYFECLEITGKVFSRRGSITVMATDEEALLSSPYYISQTDALTGAFPPVIRTVESATSNTVTITGVSGLSKDELMGRRVRLIQGPSPGGSDIHRAVWANDDSVLTLDRDWFTPPSPGAEIVLEQPGVEFNDGDEFTLFGDNQRPYVIAGCIGEDQGVTDGQLIDQIQIVGIKFRTHGLIADFETFGIGGKVTGNKGITVRFTACEEQTVGPLWSNNEHVIPSNYYYWPDSPGNYLDVGYGLVIGSPIDPAEVPPEPTGTLIIRKIPVTPPFTGIPFAHNSFSYDEDNLITLDNGFFTFNPPELGPIIFHFTLTHPNLTTEDIIMTYPVDTVGPPGEIILTDMPIGTYIITEHVDESEPDIFGSGQDVVPWYTESISVTSASAFSTDISTPLADVSATIELIENDTTIVTFENSVLTPVEV